MTTGPGPSSSTKPYNYIAPQGHRETQRPSLLSTGDPWDFPGAAAAERIDEENRATIALFRALGGRLEQTSFSGQVDEAREKLPGLSAEQIDLSNLNLSYEPRELSQLAARTLNLSGNRLTSFPTHLPSGCTSLNLSHNIIYSSARTLEIPPSMQDIDLSHNQLTSIPKISQPIPSLNLDHNKIPFSEGESRLHQNTN